MLYVICKDLRLKQMCKIPPVLSGVRVARSLVLGVCFVDRSFVLFVHLLSFGHCVVCSSSIDGF